MNKKIKVTIIVEDDLGTISEEKYLNTYDKLHNEEWNEIVRLLLDETISKKEF